MDFPSFCRISLKGLKGDQEGFINVYVLDGDHVGNLVEPFKKKKTVGGINNVGTIDSSLGEVGTSTLTPSHFSPTRKTFRSKIPFVRPLQHKENTEEGGDREEETDSEGEKEGSNSESEKEAESSDPSDEDVELSEDDFDDDDDDDDLFFEYVDDDQDTVKGSSQQKLANDLFSDQDEDEDELISDQDELISDDGSDEDDDLLGKDKVYPVFNPDVDFQRSVELSLGLRFPTNKILRKAIRHHAIEQGYNYYFMHNDRKRVCIYCKLRCECPWIKGEAKLGKCKCSSSVRKCKFKLDAKKVVGEETFQIMGLSLEHRCGWQDINSKVSSEYLAERYLDYFRIDPSWKLDVFQKKVMLDLGVEIGYYKAYYAKEKALKLIFGVASDEYKRVWDYAATVKKYDSGTSVYVKLANIERPPPVFERMYMCFDACKKGFIEGCRPLLGLDGCHLKGPHPGQLLTAVGKDGNCNIFPVAWAVVEVESKETWIWFLELLVKDIGEIASKVTFMSDRQKGLLESLNKVVPEAESRYCIRHIWTNFKDKFPGEAYKQSFSRAARAYTVGEYESHMEVIKGMSLEAHGYLTAIPTSSWCRHAFSANCTSGMLLNNCCESYNSVLRKCRDKSVLSMMEWMRRYNMKRLYEKRVGVEKYEGRIMPSAIKQLSGVSKLGKTCMPFQSGPMQFEVECNDDRFVVDLEQKTCGCNKWKISGIPCPHAFVCIMKKRLDPEDFVHQAFSKNMYLKAYGGTISPLPGPKQWEKTDNLQPDPPAFRKMPGRPSLKKRRKRAGENEERQLVKKRKTKKKCGNCGQMGHNRKGCRNPTVEQPPRRKNATPQSGTTSTHGQEEMTLTQNHPQ